MQIGWELHSIQIGVNDSSNHLPVFKLRQVVPLQRLRHGQWLSHTLHRENVLLLVGGRQAGRTQTQTVRVKDNLLTQKGKEHG